MLGSLGVPEIIFILVLALLIFGPKRLPEIGRTVGKGLAEFRRASSEIQRTINAELALEEEPRPTQFPRRVTIPEPDSAAPEARTPPEGALARRPAWEDPNVPDGPPVDLVDMAYADPQPDDAEGPSATGSQPTAPSVAPAADRIEPS